MEVVYFSILDIGTKGQPYANTLDGLVVRVWVNMSQGIWVRVSH